jgi:hypothetical protein
MSLDFFQRILRRLGFYKETHKEVVRSYLTDYSFNRAVSNNQGFAQRIQHVWGVILASSPFLKRKQPLKEESPSLSPKESSPPAQSLYQSKIHSYTQRDLRVEPLMKQYQKALNAQDLKNIQRAVLFGDWKGMEYNIDNEFVKKGQDFVLLEKIAHELPELGNYLFFNKRGNGECGYRTIVDGIIHSDCIQHNRIGALKASIQTAFDTLIKSWNSLPFDAEEKELFPACTRQVLRELDNLEKLPIPKRMAKLQDEAFLAPFLTLIRCLIVSQTKLLEGEKIDEQELANIKRTREILEDFSQKAPFNEQEEKKLSYAMRHYSLADLLGDAHLSDIPGNDLQNMRKDELKKLVRRAHEVDSINLTELNHLVHQGHELSNKENILTAPLAETLDLDISLDEFLKQKALGNADSPRAFWAIGSDFSAVGYALKKNICCIYREAHKVNSYGIQKTYPDQPADFYGLNLTGQVHYNALLPLV